jgi:hypothetical protein
MERLVGNSARSCRNYTPYETEYRHPNSSVGRPTATSATGRTPEESNVDCRHGQQIFLFFTASSLTACRGHPASYWMGNGNPFPGSEAAGTWHWIKLSVHSRTCAQERRYVLLPEYYYGNGGRGHLSFLSKVTVWNWRALFALTYHVTKCKQSESSRSGGFSWFLHYEEKCHYRIFCCYMLVSRTLSVITCSFLK